MNFGPNDALGAGRIGPATADLELFAGGVKERVLRNGAHEMLPVVSEPDAIRASNTFFFKVGDDGKMQFLVRFPSGVTQIIATEP